MEGNRNGEERILISAHRESLCSRYTEKQIPGVLYASVNPEYRNATDGMSILFVDHSLTWS